MAETVAELIAKGKDITTHLTDTGKERLRICEGIIKSGLNTFLDVGSALAEIRDRRLYREAYPNYTFERYCKEVWDLSKGYANRQIGGYETVNLLESKMAPVGAILETPSENPTDQNEEKCTDCEHRKAMANRKYKGVKIPGEHGKCTREGGLCEKKKSTMVDKNNSESTETSEKYVQPHHREVILPMNERQTRPLTKLKDPDDQVKAWGLVLEQVNDGKKLTAVLVSKMVKKVRGEVIKQKRKEKLKVLDATERVSKLYKRQIRILSEVINNERDSGWQTTSKKEAVRWLNILIKLVTEDD